MKMRGCAVSMSWSSVVPELPVPTMKIGLSVISFLAGRGPPRRRLVPPPLACSWRRVGIEHDLDRLGAPDVARVLEDGPVRREAAGARDVEDGHPLPPLRVAPGRGDPLL